jgi:hypothetical protein
MPMCRAIMILLIIAGRGTEQIRPRNLISDQESGSRPSARGSLFKIRSLNDGAHMVYEMEPRANQIDGLFIQLSPLATWV